MKNHIHIHTSRTLRLAAVAALLSSSTALGQTWTGATSGNWTDAGNWSSAPAFDTSTDLTFYQAGAGNLSNFIGGNLTARSLTFNADADADVSIRLTTTESSTTARNLTFDGGGSGAALNINSGAAGNFTLGVANGNVILADNLTVGHAGSGELFVNRVINESGSRSLTKNGTGAMAISVNSTFSGGLILNEGVFIARGAATTVLDIGSGPVTLAGGTLQFNALNWATNKTYNNAATSFVITANTTSTMEYVNPTDTARNLTLAGTSATTTLNGDLLIKNTNAEGANVFVYTQPISGAGKLSYEGNNDLSVNMTDRRLQLGSNNSAWSGGLEVRKGAARPTSVGGFGTGNLTLGVTASGDAAGLYYSTDAGTITNNFTITTGGLRLLQAAFNGISWTGNFSLSGNLTYDAATGASTISGSITGAGGLIKTGNGTLVLPGAAGYTGATIINAGTLQIGNNGTTGSLATSSTITTNGTLNFSRSNTVTQGTDFASVISGSGGVTHAGNGTLILSGNNTYDGTTFISGATGAGGTLRITHANALGSTVGSTNIQGGAPSTGLLEIIGGLSLAENITIGGKSNGTPSLRNVSGDSTLGGTVTLTTGGVEYNIECVTGLLTINSNLTTASTNATRSLNISGDGNVALGGSIADFSVSSTIGVSKSGNGTLTLSGSSSYSGNTTVNGGTLTLADGGSLRFIIGAGGINNRITGNATANLNGKLVLNLTNASTTEGDSWSIVDVASLNESYGGTFAVESTLGAFSNSSGTWTISENDVTYSFVQSTGVLTVGPAAGGYTDWANTNVGGQTPGQDFDHDGIDNGAEYFMGTAGDAFTPNPQPVAGVITWPVAGVSDASAIVEVSNNLSDWTNAAVTFPGSVDTTSNPAQIQFTVPTGQGKLFSRLTVTVTP